MSKSSKKPSGSSSSASSKSKPTSNNENLELIVRPAQINTSNIAKAYISLETLRNLGIEAGSYIQVNGNDVLAIATPQSIDPDVIMLSLELQLVAQILPGDRLRVQKACSKPRRASQLTVECTSDYKSEENLQTTKDLLQAIGLVHAGQWVGDSIRIVSGSENLEDNLSSMNLNDASSETAAGNANHHQYQHCASQSWLVDENTIIIPKRGSPRRSAFSSVGGLDKELELLRAQIELPLKFPAYFSRFNTEPERGVLLYGPPGTGKTMLLKAIARETGDTHILRVNGPSIYSKYYGEAEGKLRAIFDEAQRFAPSIIFIDEIDALAPKRDSDDSGETESRVVSTMLTLMDGMKPGGRVVVIGATNRPNMLDPALRRPGRLGHEIEIGIPDARGRQKILETFLNDMPHHLKPTDITDIAEKSHGYVGADLQALVREAVINVVRSGLADNKPADSMYLERVHLDAALVAVRPSAMREIALELPSVHWADIGGQDQTIQRLQETVEWPLQRRDTFDRLGISPPRGVLLYGPPGCSKTLLAKALATETGLNFLAVKGPELFNKYVGESERAIREVFRKARQAAPSIIFFDEIDALSVARGEGEAGGDRVLTSLLNEMDGIEALNEVVVLAATNRPDVIDSALMRPGRLDRLIYVRPPDAKARRQILLIQFAKMSIDDSVDLDTIADMTEGFSGAEIVSVCQEAGMLAMNDDPNIESISQHHFEAAIKGIRRTVTPEMIKFFENFAGEA